MSHNIFENRKTTNSKTNVPVWFMRQAGRYHSHYQGIKKNSDFMQMCRTPKLACEVTLGPIQDFNFDAAILFSDLLFPLEHLGLGLNYLKGPPELSWHLDSPSKIQDIKYQGEAIDFYKFQKDATALLKESLPKDKTLLGFVGAPFTLYTYAVEGSHAGNLVSTKKGFYDGRWSGFLEKLIPTLLTEMNEQAKGGADAIALFDTAAGELCVADYQEFIIPALLEVMTKFKAQNPKTKLIYYSKMTQRSYFELIKTLPIDVVGVDWRCNLTEVASIFPSHVYIQGNVDPAWLHLPWHILEKKLDGYFNDLKKNNFPLNRWIAGLGHGVLIETPEINVRNTIKHIHEKWLY